MNPIWHQVNIHFPTWDSAEHTAVTELAPLMADTETTGLITSWFFLRKAPCWRLRFRPVLPGDLHPATGGTSDPATVIHQRLDTLYATGRIARWVDTIYEPEAHAFGGPTAMDTAHYLFHQDSRHILAYLGNQHLTTPPPSSGAQRRREVAILLCTTLMRSAGQDWHEQGDIWARVAEHRHLPPDTPPDRLHTCASTLRQLMSVDTARLAVTSTAPLAFLSDWAATFDQVGRQLGDMARSGTLRRGLRAVLAQHVIFAWNRIGLSHPTQSLLAHAAAAAVFGP